MTFFHLPWDRKAANLYQKNWNGFTYHIALTYTGSLQDILENADIKLDRLFCLSLLHDIAKGMHHLHGSDLKSHGNLKSSNCVIDSRWVLKITDFGLHIFKSKQDTSHIEQAEHHRSLLWRSPELLRLADPPPRGTQKADSYSFAIIVQEFHTREGTVMFLNLLRLIFTVFSHGHFNGALFISI